MGLFSSNANSLWRQVYHLILMGLFSFLLNSSLRCQTISLFDVRILMGSLIVYLLVLAEELSQFWVVSRNVEAYDLLFNFIGIYLFGILAIRNTRMKAKKQFT
jgi:VanZ family protein